MRLVGDNNNQGQPTQGQPQQKIDLKLSKPIVCGECGYDVFIPGLKARKISKVAANTPQDIVIPLDVQLCGNCGEIIDELVPEQLKVLEQMDRDRDAKGKEN